MPYRKRRQKESDIDPAEFDEQDTVSYPAHPAHTSHTAHPATPRHVSGPAVSSGRGGEYMTPYTLREAFAASESGYVEHHERGDIVAFFHPHKDAQSGKPVRYGVLMQNKAGESEEHWFPDSAQLEQWFSAHDTHADKREWWPLQSPSWQKRMGQLIDDLMKGGMTVAPGDQKLRDEVATLMHQSRRGRGKRG